MIVKEKCKAYRSKQTLVHGRGFVDTLKDVGSYVYQNKDLIAKPMLGAVGDIAAFGMTEASKALIRKIAAEKSKNSQLTPESEQILEQLRKSGSGLKRF